MHPHMPRCKWPAVADRKHMRMRMAAAISSNVQCRACGHYRAGIFDEEQARLYTAEIVAAIAHLHSLHIVHRDLKPVRT
jgi:serine/threonine protein kinase